MSDVERITARNHDRARMEEAFRRMQQRPPRRPRRRSGISLVLYVITGGLLAIGFARSGSARHKPRFHRRVSRFCGGQLRRRVVDGGRMMAYARCCPFCGAYLDPCEICDCQTEEKETAAPRDATSESGTENISTTTLHHKEEKVNV